MSVKSSVITEIDTEYVIAITMNILKKIYKILC